MNLLIALGVAVAIGAVLRLVFGRIDPATVGDYAGCRGWCEGDLAGCGGPHPTRVPEQPVNTYTNLVYAAAGVALALETGGSPAWVFALGMVVLCVGSSLYHGLSTRWAGRFDVGAMYGVFSALAAYALCRALAVPAGWTALAMLLLGLATGTLGSFLRGWYSEGVNLKIAIFLIVPYLLAVERVVVHGATAGVHLVWSSFALFACAMAAWQLDRRCAFPLERWGHGLWHLLTGTGITLLFAAVQRVT